MLHARSSNRAIGIGGFSAEHGREVAGVAGDSVGGRQTRALAPRVALAAATLLLMFALGEVALRVAWHNPFDNEDPDHLIKLRIQHALTDHIINRSMIDPEVPTVRFRADERSYLRPSFEHVDPDLTIAFLGGSTTANVTVQESLRFHALVADALFAHGLRVNALNAARSGGTLHDSINVFFNHVLADEPDIVVLMHATNDIGVLDRDPTYESRRGRPVQMPDLGKWAFQWTSARSSVAGLLRSALSGGLNLNSPAARIAQKNDPDKQVNHEQFEARLRTFVRMARAFDVTPVLMTQPLANSTTDLTPAWADLGSQDLFNEVVRRVAFEEEVPLVDLVRFFDDRIEGWKQTGKLFYDGMHVTDEGSRRVSEAITEVLLECCVGEVVRGPRDAPGIAPIEGS